MQRVLSLQAARGFGESSEFVTKRMCFSFLFSIGFLCLLCGFLIGRFAAQRAVDIRAEKEQKLVAGNGLESGEHLLQRTIEKLENRKFDWSADRINGMQGMALQNASKQFLVLNFYSKLWNNGNCLTATIPGAHEKDRYVILTTGGEENIKMVLEIVRDLQELIADNDWKPRRTLMFLLYENSLDECLRLFPDYKKTKIVALLAIDGIPNTGNGYLVSSGSEVVQTTVLASFKDFAGPKTDEITYFPRLKLNIPHSVITFMASPNNTSLKGSHIEQQITSHRKSLVKILISSLWKLSQMNIFQWNPRLMEDAMRTFFFNLTAPHLRPYIEKIQKKLSTITEHGRALNDKIAKILGIR
uniref:Naaladl1 protein n=1 Tax=Fopius arisanus TaxID=64838 RepID=A0A0C9RCK5_9HYME